MGAIRKISRVKLVAGILSSDEALFGAAVTALSLEYGDTDYRSGLIPFNFTRHYEEEMGGGLLRQFVSFRNLVDPGSLYKIKLGAMEIESGYLNEAGGRRVNIDPGYVEGAKLVLATSKNYDHRIYLGGGIFAEVTLHFRGSSFIPWKWTYPDYRTKEYIDIFNHIRTIYMEQLTAPAG